MNTHLECPSCRQSDGVVNVQAAYDNEASRISKDDYVLTMTHIGVAPTMMPRESAVPALSRKLNPREEKPDTSYGCGMWILMGIFVLLLAGPLLLADPFSEPTSVQIIVDCIGVLIVVGVFLYVGRPVFRLHTARRSLNQMTPLQQKGASSPTMALSTEESTCTAMFQTVVVTASMLRSSDVAIRPSPHA